MAMAAFSSPLAYRMRDELGYSLILTHIGYDQDVNDKIKSHVANVLMGTPTVAAVIAANAAIAAANLANVAAVAAGLAPGPVPALAAGVAGQLPADWLPQLYRWIKATLANPRPSGILTLNQDNEFDRAKLTDVGIDRDTISRFHMRLNRINNQRQIAKPILDVWIKFLSQITFPKLLADKAIMELQMPSFIIAVGPNAGQPDLPALSNNFEELWHTIYDRGVEIKPQAAPAAPSDRSSRVDGMMNSVLDAPINPNNYDWTGISQPELHEAYFTSTGGGEAFAFLRDERNCWICKGYGHSKADCPSDQKVKRPISGCIKGLEALKAIEDSRGGPRPNPNFRNRKVVRRPGRSPGQRPTAHEAAVEEDSLVPYVQYDDGGIYTADGAEVVAPPSVETLESSKAVVITTEKPPDVPVSQPDPQANTAANSAAVITHENIDSLIEQDFRSTFSGMSARVEDDPFIHHVKEQKSFTRSGSAVLVGVAAALGTLALVARSNKGRALLTFLTLATGCKGMDTGYQHVEIHSSEYSKSSAYTPTSAFNLSTAAVSSADHGTMDSGTTECSSGRRKLFRTEAIERWHPPIRVEVASGVSLSVLFTGAMDMKVRRTGTTSAKKLLTISVPHSLHVPAMPVTLVSTKALFRYNGIRTYFNDELCMILTDGSIVEFFETRTNYTVEFTDDSTSIAAVRIRNPQAPLFSRDPKTYRSTLRDPLPLTWDLLHDRFCHFNPERISASKDFISGTDIASLGRPSRHKVCIDCIHGSFRGHHKGRRSKSTFTRFAQRIYSDSCAMPKSTPFGFVEMYIFYDACTKYIAVYYGKTTQSSEMLQSYQEFNADHKCYMPRGHVEEWMADGGPEFKSPNMDKFCAEMHTRRRFIAPWNPWMNVAETGWRIILRPLRIILAASNVSRAFWPFAVNQIVMVHNSLSSASDTSNFSDGDISAATVAFARSFIAAAAPSPFYNVTGKKKDLSNLRCIFCEVWVRIRSKPDLRARSKVDPLTMRGMYLGPSQKHAGQAMVHLFDVQRFTVASYNDIFFNEAVRPRLDFIVGAIDLPGIVGQLPTLDQQLVDTDGVSPPELTLPIAHPHTGANPANNGGVDNGGVNTGGARDIGVGPQPPRNPNHGAPSHWRENHCEHPQCEFDNGHFGAHSHELDAAAQPRRPGLTARNRTRDVASVVAAVEGDVTNTLEPLWTTHNAYTVAIAGDAPDTVIVSYNLNAPESGDGVPRSTSEALNGPRGDEWLAAYQKDLQAKIKNDTFELVPRPSNAKVLKTKVAHAHKYENPNNSSAVTELRARWVGMGFLQGAYDFTATYCATPPAVSCRMFFALTKALSLTLAQGDVTKAFTLNPIDVDLHVEQMPGMEVAGDFPGATKANTVCKLKKCLEGLKQAGNIWQTTHSAWLDGRKIVAFTCTIVQSQIDPCLFIGHCSAGIIAILVWVDDILVGFSNRKLYDAFAKLYSERFPSRHHIGCVKFAGITVSDKPDRLVIHQKSHIEHAFNKFVVDKVAASKSPAIYRPAISDRNSPLHYSKLTLAGSDEERAAMKSIPFLPCLATFMYVTHFTLPNFAFYSAFLGQFMHDPSMAGWEALLCLIIYAYYHRDDDVITYRANRDSLFIPRCIPRDRHADFKDVYGFHSYCDASWLLRSLAGYVIMFMDGPVDWASKLIRVITHSSAEAEIAAGCMLGKRQVYIIQFLAEFKVRVTKPAISLIDNTAADDLSGKFGVTPKTAHFLRWQHYLRWLVKHGYIEILFVPTADQLADIMTKVVDYSTFLAACRILFKIRSK